MGNCIICKKPLGDGSVEIEFTTGARLAIMMDMGVDPADKGRDGVCKRCNELSPDERNKAALEMVRANVTEMADIQGMKGLQKSRYINKVVKGFQAVIDKQKS